MNLGRQPLPFKGTGISDSQQLQLLHNQAQTNSPEGEFHQFAYVDEPFLSWDFSLKTSDDRLIGSVNRNFAGFAREIFTDTGVYALRMDSVGLSQEAPNPHHISQTSQAPSVYNNKNDGNPGMTLDQRAVMLATAVSVDFDYFSRHSNSHGGILPFPIPFFGWGGSAGEGAGAVGAAEAGAGAVAGEGAAGTASGIAGGMAGAGSIAGYEAMQGGFGSRGDGSSQVGGSQDAGAPEQQQQQQSPHDSPQQPFDERPWWEQDQEMQQREQNPWGSQENDGQGWGDMNEDGDEGDWTDDFF
ncbi:hypothetical protein KEM56_004069 [Ascosphaera pollenicola]|nr:hypothetical protein KEM56_004069 [Ascosphaera pollenicola]